MISLRSRRRIQVLSLVAGSLVTVASLAFAQTGPSSVEHAPSEITYPKARSKAKVQYPASGQGAATVTLEVTVLKSGKTGSVIVREGAEPFASAARSQVRRWVFTPATRNAIPVDAKVLVRVDFDEPKPEDASTSNATGSSAPKTTTEILVTGERTAIGTTFIPIEEAREVPGAFTDPFRAAAIQPGVAPILNGLPYYIVRGSSPSNVGYLVDGIRVPYLFHVGAGPSIVAPSLVQRVELYPSAFPTSIGQFAGAVLSGQTKGLSPVARGEVLIRGFDTSALVEAPIGDATVLMAGRLGYLQPTLDRFSPEYRAGYWDYQTRLGYRIDAKNTITLLGFGASDFLRDDIQGITLFDSEFHRLDLRWLSLSASGKTQVAFTVGQDKLVTAVSPNHDLLNQAPYPTTRRSQGANLRVRTEQQLSTRIRIDAGLDYRGDTIEDTSFDSITLPRRTDWQLATDASLPMKPTDSLEIIPGIRLETGLWRDSGYLYPEPRLASRLRIGNRLAWTSALGIVHQLPSVSVRGPGFGPTLLSEAVQEAYQASQTLEFSMSDTLTGHVTGFYTHVRGRTADAATRIYGGELFVKRDLTEEVGFIVSYTLTRSSQKEGDSPYRLGILDRTHLLSAALGLDLGLGLHLGTRGYLASGRPYGLACPPLGCEDDPTATELTGRLPPFFRADVRLDRRWEFDSGTWFTLAAEWFNATMSDEDYEAVLDPETGSRQFLTQKRIIFPSINLEAGF